MLSKPVEITYALLKKKLFYEKHFLKEEKKLLIKYVFLLIIFKS